MTDEQSYITLEGLEKLQTELNHLKTARRREIAEKIERAKELGDLSENAEYHEAKDEQAFIEGRILELEGTLHTAQIVAAPTRGDQVEIGSSVQVKFNGDERQFSIVGASEADPSHGKISNESPLGRALIGHSVGDEFPVQTPRGTKTYRILGIT